MPCRDDATNCKGSLLLSLPFFLILFDDQFLVARAKLGHVFFKNAFLLL
jgi:hypothetical protein